jgi:hypothetical protein
MLSLKYEEKNCVEQKARGLLWVLLSLRKSSEAMAKTVLLN